MAGQLLVSAVAGLAFIHLAPEPLDSTLAVPFLKDVLLPLGWLFLPVAMLVMVGASNAVNLTDGLDGLAIGPVMIAAGCFSLISYVCGNVVFANYLQIHHVPGAGELAVFCATLVGSGLGFLWYNAHPAQVIMGDTGALALGSSLAVVALMTGHWLLLPVIGIVFVIEAVSDVIQVGYFKLSGGKRVFRRAPYHNHLEMGGWAETQIVTRAWLVGIVAAMLGVAFALAVPV